MRIEAYNQISQVYKPNTVAKTQTAGKAKSSDKVEISNFGKVLQTAKEAIKETPDIREGLVADIKEKIDNGTYDVNADDLAAKLLGL